MKTSDLIKLGLTPEQAKRLSRNGQYWKTRFGQVEQAQHDRGVAAFQKIDEQYRQAQKSIEAKIDAWYRRFADNEGITLQEARRQLDARQLAEFKWDVNDYIRYGKENAISGQWAKELENASARFHISRLEALKVQCQQDAEVLFGSQADIFDQAMRDIYKSGYYHNAFTLQKGIGVGWDFSALDPKHIDRVINTPWTVDGRNFSTRIWDSKEKLIGEIDQTLTQNIILGKDPQKAIDAIAARLNVSKSQAGRLVMTEEAYFSSMAQQDCFRELDVEDYEIVATFDNITSDICREMDGKRFKMSQWEIGVTAPPFHPWCRTTTVPSFDDDFGSIGERAAKDENGKTYYVPANMTYKQWEKAFVQGDKTGVQEVIREQSKRKYDHPDLVINTEKIQSAEYHKAFQELGESSDVARSMWNSTKKMLDHRSGSEYEDLIYIDSRTGKTIVQDQYSKKPRQVEPTKRMKQMVRSAPNGTIIAIHNHAHNSTPSVGDLKSAYKGKYKYGIIACHNGNLFKYSVLTDSYLEQADYLLENLNRVMYDNTGRYTKTEQREMLKDLIERLHQYGVDFEVLI